MRAQSAIEYLIVVGIFAAVLVPLLYVYLYAAHNATEDVMVAQTQKVAKEIIANSQDVYYAAGPARRELKMRIPDFVTEAGSFENNSLFFDTEQRSYVYPSDVPINATWSEEDLRSGIIVIEKKGSGPKIVYICGNYSCLP